MGLLFRTLLICGLLWVAVPPVCFCAPAKKERYISQELIDTSIQRGFILLNESADMAGVGFRHQKSIVEAKKIVKLLREKARGDPNEKYVLWKAGELEAQIYLEESDLLFQEMQKRQLTINELVAKYNSEVGKWRPDFATLYRIHKNMDQVDAGKANELADSYNQRKRAISREAVYFLEKALLAGSGDSARRELGYCLRNRLYLDISESAYKRLEDRVEGLLRAQDSKPVIEAGILSARLLLDRKDITEARRTLDTASGRLADVKPHLPQRDAIALASSFKRTHDRLGALEDSLVNVNIAILRGQGVEAADRYLQSVLRALGVSHEKAAQVDRMIIAVKSPDDGKPSAVDGLPTDEPEENPVLDNIMIAAKKKAQEKKDSLQAIENARLWKERQEQNRLDSIAQVARAAEEAALRVKQLRVDSVAMAIYAFIEKNDPKAAKKLFAKEEAFLGKFQRQDEFSMLKTTIDYFAETPAQKKSEVTFLKPVEGKTAEPPPPQSPSEVELQTNLDRAQAEIVGIYSMLEKNDVDNAYKRFQARKAPLQKYLAPEAFSMLEMTVKAAYEYYAGKR